MHTWRNMPPSHLGEADGRKMEKEGKRKEQWEDADSNNDGDHRDHSTPRAKGRAEP